MTNTERLSQLHAAYTAAGGPADLVALMGAVLSAGPSEALAASTVEHVESGGTVKETLALAAIGHMISADASPPSLWLAIDVKSTFPDLQQCQTIESTLRTDGALRIKWGFRRESPTMLDGGPLAARILFPGGLGSLQHVDAATRVLQKVWSQWVTPARDARAALLAAALETQPNVKK
jgi:hypothetical protein